MSPTHNHISIPEVEATMLASVLAPESGAGGFPAHTLCAELDAGVDGWLHGTGDKADVMGRLSSPPNAVLFKLLYESQAARDHAEVLPYLLQIDAAHLVMLERTQLLPRSTAAALLSVNRELCGLLDQKQKAIPLPEQHRGFYFLYEREYIRRLGKKVGGAAHLARSRNDINATVTRLRVRAQLIEVLAEFCGLAHVMSMASQNHADTVMCGFTHLQPAQPSTLGHYFAGALAELTRSAELLDRAFEIVNCSPMGAAAGFGTSFPIVRGEVAQLLGFVGIIENSADAVASRDYLVHVLSAMAMLGVTLTRIATDLQSWSSVAYGFLGWADDLVSTSSIMPQKRNAFVLENIRGQAIQPVGCLVNTLTGMKNLSFSNSVELSGEATSHVWPALKSLTQAIRLTRLLIEHLAVDSGRMLQFLVNSQTTMTALADWLVARHGFAFRIAHDSVSRLVTLHPTMTTVSELKISLQHVLEDVAGATLHLDESELALVLDPVACARRAIHGGGPAGPAVRSQLRSLIRRNSAIERQLKTRRRDIKNAELQLRAAADGVIRSTVAGGSLP